MSDIIYRGMNVSRPDETTPDEIERFLGYGDQPTGRPLPSYELWAELRPDILKRLLNHVHHIHSEEAFTCPLPYLNVYAVGGWGDGVEYIIKSCEPGTFMTDTGYSKEAILETFAVAFYLAPSWGPAQVADVFRTCLQEYQEPAVGAPSPYPEGWEIRPELLKAGLDSSTSELTKEDLRNLREWWMRLAGEVPRSVDFYAKYRPQLLKAQRLRWENIPRAGLPNEMLAYLLLHYEVWRGNPEGMREALLLARGLGMSKAHVVDAIFYGGSFYGGGGTLALADSALGELLDGWAGADPV